MSELVAFARTVDEDKDFFETYIFPNSTRKGLQRIYPENVSIKGNFHTKLMVISGGTDTMDSFP